MAIYDILTQTAQALGFTDFEVNDDNLAQIGVTNPEDRNTFISQLNLIINESFFKNVGEYSELGKYLKIRSQKNGVGRKITKFTIPNHEDYLNGNFHTNRNNTLEQMVALKPNHQNVNISTFNSTVNNRFTPYISIDTRELAKAFTVDGLSEYIKEVYDFLSEAFYDYVTYVLIQKYLENKDKTFKVNENVFPTALSYIFALQNGVKNGDNIDGFSVSLPDNFNDKIRAYKDDLFVITTNNQYTKYFTEFHINPEIKIFNNKFDNLPYDIEYFNGIIANRKAINIETYNESVEEFTIPNNPTMTNVFFNADIAITIDFSYPQVEFLNEKQFLDAPIVTFDSINNISFEYDNENQDYYTVNIDVFDSNDEYLIKNIKFNIYKTSKRFHFINIIREYIEDLNPYYNVCVSASYHTFNFEESRFSEVTKKTVQEWLTVVFSENKQYALDPTLDNANFELFMNFGSNGDNYIKMTIIDNTLYYFKENFGDVEVYTNGTWSNTNYRIIIPDSEYIISNQSQVEFFSTNIFEV